MSECRKGARVCKALEADERALELINRQTLSPVKAEDVFLFRVRACDDQPDRDGERFTADCLEGLSRLFIGKTMIVDHNWTAKGQIGRVYDATVEEKDGAHALILSVYMLRSEQNAPVIADIEGGIRREVSVGCAVGKAVCSICGTDKTHAWCEHRGGEEYGGKTCVVELSDPADAYEVSFCAVPAQPAAGVTKKYGGEDRVREDQEREKVLALLALEEKRF